MIRYRRRLKIFENFLTDLEIILRHEPLTRLPTNQFINTMILSVCCVAMRAILFVQYYFWCRGALQEKQGSIFSHNQKLISLIQEDGTTKPGDEMARDEMAWGRSDY